MRKILSLDLGSTTGWAFYSSTVGAKPEFPLDVASGIWTHKRKNREHEGKRFAKFRVWLVELLYNWKPQEIYYEDCHGIWKGRSDLVYKGFRAILLMECFKKGVVPIGVPQKALKNTMTSNGNAGKEQMVKAAMAMFPSQGAITHDEADALALIHYAVTEKK